MIMSTSTPTTTAMPTWPPIGWSSPGCSEAGSRIGAPTSSSTGRDAGNRPAWTDDIAGRGAVFTHEGRCYRSGISYDAGLKRYLWCQVLPGGDPRFRGGFGIYDAPEPWGPWSTAYFTEAWDVGPGETSCFPPSG